MILMSALMLAGPKITKVQEVSIFMKPVKPANVKRGISVRI